MSAKKEDHILHFSKNERRAIITLLFLIVMVKFLPFFWERIFPAKIIYNNGQVLEQFNRLKSGQDQLVSTPQREIKNELFYFDPNILSKEGWIKLGVSEKVATNILKYISKGGKFRKPSDLEKIWGLRQDQVSLLVQYVIIKEDKKFVSATRAFSSQQYNKIDINTADSALLETLPGIGGTLAKRIILFREKLGGFVSVEQIGETYGLRDSVFQKIRPRLEIKIGGVRKLNINTLSNEQLQQHPYIRFKLASQIVAFRDNHGSYKSIEDLRQIMTVTDSIFVKISPYLVIE